MVDHADFLVGVFDNAKQMRSGTAQTVNYALRQGKQIILIHPDTADTAYLRWITNSQKVNRPVSYTHLPADIIFIPEIRLIDCRYYLLGFFVQGIETCKYVFF